MPANLPYSGAPRQPPSEPLTWDTDLRESLDRPAGYLPDPGLVKAVNVALLLGQPLLLTGEPGVGKSLLAGAVAYALGLGEAGEFFAKSDMRAADLFYHFDHMRRLYDYQTQKDRPATDYLTFNALGRAILLAGGPDAMTTPLPGIEAQPIPHKELLEPGGFDRRGPQSVVLIDEIDKAPRDVPNDILNEIDRMLFEVPEIGQRIAAPKNRKPFVVMTSNSEKNLPSPFLRRCVFYNIPFPEIDPKDGAPSLEEIVVARIAELDGGGRLLDDAIDLFARLRDPVRGFDNRPSPAELLNWLMLLVHDGGLVQTDSLRLRPDLARDYLSVLLKTPRDQALGLEIVGQWLNPTDRSERV